MYMHIRTTFIIEITWQHQQNNGGVPVTVFLFVFYMARSSPSLIHVLHLFSGLCLRLCSSTVVVVVVIRVPS